MQSYIKNEPSNLSGKSGEGILRYGQYSDLDKIHHLLEPFFKKGILLNKDRKKIEADLPRTLVYCLHDQIIGVANLYKYDKDLYELRGLAIDEKYQKSGIGRKLIHKLVRDLTMEFPDQETTIFALTKVPEFFIKQGWKLVKKEKFPRKIFDDCTYCLKKDECFEDAVEIVLNRPEDIL